MPASESPDLEPQRQQWTLQFEYEFKFDDARVHTLEEAEAFGRAYVDEAVRTAIILELRDERKLSVLVGIEGHYGVGSLSTFGIARILTDWRDVPAVKEALEQFDWFWTQLQIVLGTKFGRKVVLRDQHAELVGAFPGKHLSPGARRAVLRNRHVRHPNRNLMGFTMGHSLNAFGKLALAGLLLATPFACDHLDRQAEQRRWRQHLSTHGVEVSLIVPSRQAPTAATSPSRGSGDVRVRNEPLQERCPAGTVRMNATTHNGERFTVSVFCAPAGMNERT